VCAASSTRVNRLLADWGRGNEEAREALIPVVYGELRRLARRHLWRKRPDHTLQSAALANEAYLRLVRQEAPQWRNRTHFFGVAAQLMRHILLLILSRAASLNCDSSAAFPLRKPPPSWAFQRPPQSVDGPPLAPGCAAN
jgi:RNA polymerase sigma factor (TIGR02999 family)